MESKCWEKLFHPLKFKCREIGGGRSENKIKFRDFDVGLNFPVCQMIRQMNGWESMVNSAIKCMRWKKFPSDYPGEAYFDGIGRFNMEKFILSDRWESLVVTLGLWVNGRTMKMNVIGENKMMTVRRFFFGLFNLTI